MDNVRQNSIRCLQINLQKSKTSTPHLVNYIHTNPYDIILVQEPYCINSKICGFPPQFKVCYKSFDGQRPKTAIIVTNSQINFKNIESYSKNDLSLAIIDCKDREILFMSVYCSPTEDLEPKLQNIQVVIESLNIRYYVISIDSNSHSSVWFDNNNDYRGDQINEFIAQNNLILLNNENTPTFETSRGSSSIDLTLVSFSLTSLVQEWQVLDEESASDHKYIEFRIYENIEKIKYKSTIKYSTRGADWSRIRSDFMPKVQLIKSQIISANNEQELNDCIVRLTTEITATCDKHLKKVNTKSNKKCNNWWTTDLTVMRQSVNRMRRRYQRCRQPNRREELMTEYLNFRESYKKAINDTKIKSWNEFVAENSRENAWGLVSKIARNKINNQIITELIAPNGRLLTDSQKNCYSFDGHSIPK